MALRMGWTKNVNRQACLYFLFVPTFLLYTLALAGCLSTSPGIPNIFLVQITAQDSGGKLKVGYFGMCSVFMNSTDSQLCSTTCGISTEDLLQRLSPQDGRSAVTDNLVEFGLTLASKILLPILAGGGVAFTLGIVLFLFFQIRVKNPSVQGGALQLLESTSLAFVGLSCVLCFGAATSITMAVGAMRYCDNKADAPTDEIEAGKPLQIIQWMTFAFSVLIGVGLRDIMKSSSSTQKAPTQAAKQPRQPLATAIDF
ncbi:hypothetical protein BO79DRAFT_252986 [Aspergillus costaricaensis CBS 115574]|uniref:Uncharacterized protein n=1 Tax=Aspergillus costaricaensis CBS 115574 TaxID=1448317 RepID=A0ACD1IJQ3_9EURO|nr:hypothetical protein BO79DRAFT_252986 [Aspergillus costaricaensis CBS 115574]RAK90803.1 hypothetical protein BO79DRAFT_252986 [Aspergillus costaricaensis CBS 115574]